jgi:SAM-dependent methyltransferase
VRRACCFIRAIKSSRQLSAVSQKLAAFAFGGSFVGRISRTAFHLKPRQIFLPRVNTHNLPLPAHSEVANQNLANQDLLDIAHRRLYPSLTDPSYLVLRSRRVIFSKWLNQVQGQNLCVLDIGGRYQPYRPLLGARTVRYVAIDLIRTGLVSVVASGEALPFAEGAFDLVVATQVMEYFREPSLASRHIHRVLKPGGVLLASVAACAPRFVDEERWRFTRTGLQSVLAPFAEVEIVPEVYSVGGVVRTVNLAADTFVRYRLARSIYRHTGCVLLNLLGLGAEKLNLTSNDQFTANYSAIARKAK